MRAVLVLARHEGGPPGYGPCLGLEKISPCHSARANMLSVPKMLGPTWPEARTGHAMPAQPGPSLSSISDASHRDPHLHTSATAGRRSLRSGNGERATAGPHPHDRAWLQPMEQLNQSEHRQRLSVTASFVSSFTCLALSLAAILDCSLI